MNLKPGTRILFTADNGDLIQGEVKESHSPFAEDICILWETNQRGTYDESFLREDPHFTIETTVPA